MKRIHIVGFKTFPDKINIELIPGINGFVGPNGCGKSNLVDAVRWGLGEQNPYALRGTRMEDMLFSGADKRKSLNMAEVILEFEGKDDDFSTFSEISIARRLFRSGESEYYINKIPVRLKDIQETLSGTGLGVTGYSFLSHDMVEFIVLSNPHDRRVLFEEIAGISHFKSEKQKILKNLDKARENLTRIHDVTGELERQLKYIKRQANKARQFKKIKEKVKDIEVSLAYKSYSELKDQKISLGKAVAELKKSELSLRKKIEEKESEIREKENILKEIEHKIEEIRQKERDVKESIIKIDGELNLYKEKKYQIGRLKENFQEREKNLLMELKETISDLEILKEKDKRGEEEIKKGEKEKILLEEKIKEFSKEKEKWEKRKDEIKERNFAVASKISHINNEISKLLLDIHNIDVKILRDGKEEKRYKEERNKLIFNLESLGNELKEKEEALKEIIEEISKLESKKEKKIEERKELEKVLSSKESFRDSLQAKVSLWKEFIKEDSQIPSGNRYIKRKYPHVPLFGDLVEVDREKLRAFESFFHYLVDALWVENWEEGKKLMKEVKNSEKGKVKLIIGKKGKEKSFWKGKMKAPGIVSLFFPKENIIWVKSIEEIKDIDRKSIVVTEEGEVIYPNGLVTAVYGEKVIVTGREKHFLKMVNEMKGIRGEIEELKEKIKESHGEIEELQKSLEEMLNKESILKKEIEKMKKEEGEILRDKEDIEKNLETLENGKRYYMKEKEDMEKNLGEVKKEKSQEENEKSIIEKEMKEIKEKSIKEDEKFEKAREELQKNMQSISHWEATIENINDKIDEVERKKGKLEDEMKERKVKVKEYEEEIKEISKKIEELEIERKEKEGEIAKISLKMKELLNLRDEREKEKIKEEINIHEVRKKQEEISSSLKEKEVSLTRIEGEMRNIYSRIYSLYQIEIDRWEGEIQDKEKEDLDSLKKRLERMGEISIGAIQEEDEIENRYNFYLNQEEDIEKSIEELKNTLRYLEKESKRRFLENFEAVRKEFSKTFQKIFEGGEADLKLTEGENFEDKGVEIMASPPGKKLSHLSLLSQGERALVAISLLFSFFRIKPSPFCMLDEIDAPLDEPNVNKLLKFFKSLRDKTQFLIISHNKKTLSEADALFGITMEEPGVSKVLSVNFTEATKISEK